MNKYLENNWSEIKRKVQAITRGHQNTDDLLSDLVVVLLSKPAEYQQDLIEKKKIQHWFTSSASLQYKSATSPFWYKYKKFQSETTDLLEWGNYAVEDVKDSADEILSYIRSELETYTVYEKTLCIEHILHGLSYSEIGRNYKINRRYVSETITPVKEEIFKKVRERWNYYLT